MANYVKLLENTWSEEFQLIYFVHRPIKQSLVLLIVMFNDHSTNYVKKIQYLIIFIAVFSIYKCITPPKQEKMWSEEIIARIALKITHVPIALFMSF